MGIPALDRGLDILDTIISRNSPLKYSDIKKTLPSISDSSLNRLLVSLIDKDFISKDSNGRYISSLKLLRWKKILLGNQSLEDEIRVAVDNVVNKLDESAAFAHHTGNRIEIVFSRSAKDSISIISRGETLHFESDHAASLAIIDTFAEDGKLDCIKGPFSKIKNIQELENGLKMFKHKKRSTLYYLDESNYRKGVCRLAVHITIDKNPCVLFICAPTVRIEENLDSYLTVLINSAKCLQGSITS